MGGSPVEVVSQRMIRAWCGGQAQKHLDATVEGLERIPQTGPVLIVARHYHYLYDGYLLLARIPRPTHLLVGLDWTPNRAIRTAMETACHLARWPIVLRGDGLEGADGGAADRGRQRHIYRAEERSRYLRRAVRDAVSVLRDGHALVIFPEGYPTIDPVYTPKTREDEFLPFREGATKIVALAQRDKQTRVAIVPAGLAYEQQESSPPDPSGRESEADCHLSHPYSLRGEREPERKKGAYRGKAPHWRVTLRFGEPLYLEQPSQSGATLRAMEEQVRQLSAPASSVNSRAPIRG